MKRIKLLNSFTAIIIAAVILSGCAGMKKMQKDYKDKVTFKATPEVLQTKGGKIAVNVSGKFSEKYFNKKAKMVITPILKYEGGATPLNTIILKGEKAEGDGIIIKSGGGSFSSDYIIDYIPGMIESHLVANPKLQIKDKSVDIGELKLADGVIVTETRIDNTDSDIQIAMHEYNKATSLKQSANIYFAYSKYNMDKNLKLNKLPENVNKLKELQDFIKKGWTIENIEVNAWASPEGEDKYNENLSQDRSKTGQTFLKNIFSNVKADKIKELRKNKNLKKAELKLKEDEINKTEYTINVSAKGEDKEGFVDAIKASDIKDKNSIINVIESEKLKSAREKKIKDMTVIYGEIESLLEPLRRAELSITFMEPKKTDEQIAMLSTSQPDSLDIDELLYAATLTNDLNTQLKIYKSAESLHMDNWKAYNNAGYTNFKLGMFDDAGADFEKANLLSPNNGIVLNNLGAVALAKNKFDEAKSYYESAKSKGVNTDYNLGIVLITQGNYEEALKSFESKKCNYNLALAQLLLDNTTGAQSTLDCADKNAEIYYLMAVIGARTQNPQMMNDNLKKAIEINPKFRKQAKIDREFIKFFDNADFMEITKF